MRKADIAVALCLLGLAVLVAWESLQLNIGWGLNGPEGGFFPSGWQLGWVSVAPSFWHRPSGRLLRPGTSHSSGGGGWGQCCRWPYRPPPWWFSPR